MISIEDERALWIRNQPSDTPQVIQFLSLFRNHINIVRNCRLTRLFRSRSGNCESPRISYIHISHLCLNRLNDVHILHRSQHPSHATRTMPKDKKIEGEIEASYRAIHTIFLFSTATSLVVRRARYCAGCPNRSGGIHLGDHTKSPWPEDLTYNGVG